MSSDLLNWRPARGPRFAIAPAAPMAVGIAAGIVLGRYGIVMGTRAWGAVGVLAVVLTATAAWREFGRTAVAFGMLGAVAVGGGWFHQAAVDQAADDLARFDWSEPRPVWLRGVLVEVPEFRPGSGAWPGDEGSTRTALELTATCDGRDWRSVSGRVLLFAGGDRTDLMMGQPVEAAGMLQAIDGPLNPGETDRRRWAIAEGIRLRLSIESVEGLQPDPTGTPRRGLRLLGWLRSRAHERLVTTLPTDVAPLAAALLLGRREAIDEDLNDAFARTGTMHLIAISGLHMQALAFLVGLLLWIVSRNRRLSALVVLIGTFGYAILVGGMPSVVRSALMTAVLGLALIGHRRAWSANVVALAALGTLFWNPLALFDVGCQLSFLAVMALIWLGPILSRSAGLSRARDGEKPPSAKRLLDELELRYAGPARKTLHAVGRWLGLALITSVAVELVTAPLVVSRFHLFSVVGIVLNIILVPLAMPTLGLAGLTLLGSVTGLPTPEVLVTATTLVLRLNTEVVRWGASIPGGHAFVASPPWPWLLGYYGLLVGLVVADRIGPAWRRAVVAGLVAWSALGVAVVLRAVPPERPEAEVLAVDHGLSVLVRAPDGSTLLYDCGRMRDPRIGRRVIAPALWERGVRRIDTVVLSHADADHYNGLPDLLDRFPIGEIRVAPEFGEGDNPGASTLLATCRARGIPLRTLALGDRIDLGGLTIQVVHPPRRWLPGAADNDRSLVLDLDHEGRRLLLTGDVEGAGLAELLAKPSGSWDILLAPHHGGRNANPTWLYDWARPRMVLVSQRRPLDPSTDALAVQERRGLPVLRTWREGAIRVRWEPDGLSVRGFRDSETPVTLTPPSPEREAP